MAMKVRPQVGRVLQGYFRIERLRSTGSTSERGILTSAPAPPRSDLLPANMPDALAVQPKPGMSVFVPRPDLLPPKMRAMVAQPKRGRQPSAVWSTAPRPELLPGMGPAIVDGLRGKATVAQARPTVGGLATPVASERLQVIGAGKSLDPEIRRRMEVFFQADFSGVRVHEGSAAQAMGALAFTLGEEIHFAPGQYDPRSREGAELIGHELAHVMQQRDGRVANPYGTGVAIVQDPELEAEAGRIGREIADRMWSRPRVGQTAIGSGWPVQLPEPVLQAMKRQRSTHAPKGLPADERRRTIADSRTPASTSRSEEDEIEDIEDFDDLPGTPTATSSKPQVSKKFKSRTLPHTSPNTKPRPQVGRPTFLPTSRSEEDEIEDIEDFDDLPAKLTATSSKTHEPKKLKSQTLSHTSPNTKSRPQVGRPTFLPTRSEIDDFDDIEDFDEDPLPTKPRPTPSKTHAPKKSTGRPLSHTSPNANPRPQVGRPTFPAISRSEIDDFDDIEDFDEDSLPTKPQPTPSKTHAPKKSESPKGWATPPRQQGRTPAVGFLASTSTKPSEEGDLVGKEYSWVKLRGQTHWSCGSKANATSLRDMLRFVLEQDAEAEDMKTTSDLDITDPDGPHGPHGYIRGMFRHLQRIRRYRKTAQFMSMGDTADASSLSSLPNKVKIIINYEDQTIRWAWRNRGVTFPGVNINESKGKSHLHRLYIYTLFGVIRELSSSQNAPVAAMLVDGATGKVMGIALKSWKKLAYHAEINLIELAWTNIQHPILYVTMVPCDMCSGRINEVMGNRGSVVYLQDDPGIQTSLLANAYCMNSTDLKSPNFIDESQHKYKTKEVLEAQDEATLRRLTSELGKEVIRRTVLSWESKVEKYTVRPENIWSRPEVGKVTLYLDTILRAFRR